MRAVGCLRAVVAFDAQVGHGLLAIVQQVLGAGGLEPGPARQLVGDVLGKAHPPDRLELEDVARGMPRVGPPVQPGETVPALAPLYDLVCIGLIVRIRAGTYDRAMAFRVGDHAVPEEIGRDDWIELARAMGLPPKPTLRRLEEMALALPDLARETRQAFAASFGDNQVYDRFEETIRDRSHWVCTSVLGAG
jgi:hypothetical protein